MRLEQTRDFTKQVVSLEWRQGGKAQQHPSIDMYPSHLPSLNSDVLSSSVFLLVQTLPTNSTTSTTPCRYVECVLPNTLSPPSTAWVWSLIDDWYVLSSTGMCNVFIKYLKYPTGHLAKEGGLRKERKGKGKSLKQTHPSYPMSSQRRFGEVLIHNMGNARGASWILRALCNPTTASFKAPSQGYKQ